jgi:flagellar biosynthesis/type III secretory pathway chaperone
MSVQPTDVSRMLERVLGDEARLLAELEQLLTREADVVRGDDPNAIENIGATRHRCVEALTRLDTERTDACRMLSFGTGREGLERLLAWCDPAQDLRARWQANLQAARRCKELNDRNGAIVTVKLGQVQQLLATLRGGSGDPVYRRQGARFEGFGRRELGRA